MDLEDQQRVIDAMRDELHPPPGVSARLAGTAGDRRAGERRPRLAVAAPADAASPASLAVALVLLAVFRRAERALVPLVPIALATGWSALVLFATRVPLNPMSATLGALVIAISTEFAVLLSERFRQERAGRPRASSAALARTYGSTGRAVLASGVTAIAGFGVLAVSDFRMLRDFGIVTVVDLTVSLLGRAGRAAVGARAGRARRVLLAADRAPRRPRARGRRRQNPLRAGRVSGAAGAGSRSRPASRSSPTSPGTRSRRRRPSSTGPARPGTRLPPFAAPLVTSDLVGDANVARHADQGAAGAQPGLRGDRPARAQQLHARAPRAGRARVLHRRLGPLHDAARRDASGSRRAIRTSASRRSRSAATATTCARLVRAARLALPGRAGPRRRRREPLRRRDLPDASCSPTEAAS